MAEVGKYIARSSELTEITVTVSVDDKTVTAHRLGHWDAPGRVFFEQSFDSPEEAEEHARLMVRGIHLPAEVIEVLRPVA